MKNAKANLTKEVFAAKANKWVIINTVIILMITLSTAALVFYYRQLRKSIEEERVEAVGQIGTLLTERIGQLEDTYGKQLSHAVYILSAAEINTYEALLADFESPSEWMLLDDNGSFFAIDGGEAILTQDNSLIQNALVSMEVFSSFISIQGRGDYWAFTQPIERNVISDRNVIALIRLVPVEEFCENTTVSLYDHMGASYIVDRQGAIVMHPEDSIREELLSGFSLFTSLKNKGVAEADYADLKAAVMSLGKYQKTFLIDGTRWLIQVLPSTSNYELVVTIPISLTAQDTYSGLSAVLMSLAFVCTSLASFVLFNQYQMLKKKKTVQMQLAKAKAKSDFMNKISHDIRTPLNALSGLHALALTSLSDKAKLHECITEAQAADEYLLSLINDVLDMSRIEAGKMKIDSAIFELKAVVDHVARMESQMALDAGITFICAMPEYPETRYMGDTVRIQQCLMNLISNALKFTPAGGKVNLTVSIAPIDDENDRISLVVADTGVGMSKEFLRNAFMPFEQERSSMTSEVSSGSGLGLSIVQNLVQLMGGTVTVESTKNVGTRFDIDLPLKKADQCVPDADNSGVPSDETLHKAFQGKRIMFVEDHKTNRKLFTGLLVNLGLIVEEAENGQICVNKFKESPEGHFSLILMDILMPVMNGLEASRAIRALARSDARTVPIIALSANAFDEDIEQSLAAGMQMHLSKPIDVLALKKALYHYIGGEEI